MINMMPGSGQSAVVFADDLTGANEIGLRFNQCGRPCQVFSPPKGVLAWTDNLMQNQDLVLNLDSRGFSETAARESIIKLIKNSPTLASRLVFKKIDSTIRGNLAAEYAGILDSGLVDLIICAPAAPIGGRVTVGGFHLVQGIPVHLSEYALGVETLTTSYLPDLLASSGIKVESISLSTVEQGGEAVAEACRAAMSRGARIVVGDACLNRDLEALKEACLSLDCRVLPSGSAALFNQFFKPGPRNSLPCLVICGSINNRCRTQIENLLRREGVENLEIDLEAGRGHPENEAQRVAAAGRQSLAEGKDLVITSPAVKSQVSRNEIESLLARTAFHLLKPGLISGLVLTGGAIAAAVLEKLNVFSLSIVEELAPLIPLCRINGGAWHGLPVVTKGGGIGNPNVLSEVVDHLRHN